MTKAPSSALVGAVDYHTAGEPFRIVTGGVPALPGATVGERRVNAADRLDHVRRLLVQEPRGHGGMYGCFITPPDDEGAEFGAVFFHQSGFSTACGHGTIALGTWAADAGIVPPDMNAFSIDVPSGRVGVRLHRDEADRVTAVSFRNVPAWVYRRAVPVRTSLGETTADIAFGGAFYASVPAASLGLSVSLDDLPRLVETGRSITDQLNNSGVARHDADERLNGIYGVIFHEDLPVPDGHDADGYIAQRNVTIFGDGQVDRSPCGSGTSARVALLAGQGLMKDQVLLHESIIGTRFEATIARAVTEAGGDAVVTEVTGSASMTGLHQFVLEARDVLGTGFSLPAL
ncbi:MAG TPA: proline racemase family protein [Streptosporangiaceae bacterium]|nr:proline racemase family protein [Streptosporangiaceae bacterium]